MREMLFRNALFICLLSLNTFVVFAQSTHVTLGGNASLNLSGTVNFRLSGEFSVLNVEGNANLEDGSNTTIILEGDLENKTNFISFLGSLVFNGGSSQNLSGAMAINNLTISNNNILSMVDGNALVSNQLRFNNSKIFTFSNSNLTLDGEVNILSAGANSFINGPLTVSANRRTGNILEFPIGKDNTYLPLRLRIDQTNSTGLYIAEAYTSDIPSNNLESGLQSVSSSKYWSIQSSESVSNTYIELPVDATDNVSSTTLARIAKETNGTWTSLGGINLTSIPGTLRSSIAFNDFGNFIIASATPSNNPGISSITPDKGKIGDIVTITGTNLGSTPGSVKFGNVTVSGSDVISWTNTQIQVRVPQGLNEEENVRIEITVNGSSSAINFDFIFTVQGEGDCNDFRITTLPKDGEQIISGTNTTLSIEVNDATLVTSAQIYFRGISQDDWQAPVNVFSNSNEFTYQVNENIDDIGIEYYFDFSFDGCSNISSDVTHAYLYYPNGVSITGLTPGNTAGDYNLFSIPYELENAGVNSVLDELGQPDKTKWRLFRVQNNSYQEFGSFSLETGRGYLLIFDQSQTFNTGPASAVNVTKDNPFTMPLRQGWNMIATPYPFPIQWRDVLSENGIGSLGDFFNYTSTGYTSGNGILSPFRGAIWFAENATTISVSPIKDASLSGGRIAANNRIKENFNSQNWELDLHLLDDKGSRITGGFGMRENASLSKDLFDGMRPPATGFHSSLHFEHNEYFYPYFLRDIVPNSPTHKWEFKVNPSGESTNLSITWDNKLIKELNLPLFLQDSHTGFVVDMSQTSTYHFANQNKNTFKIILGDGNLLTNLLIGKVFPNPAKTEINIPFSLPFNTIENKVSFSIFDMAGRKILSKSLENISGGFQESRLILSNSSLGRGMYVLNVMLESDGVSKISNYKIVIE